MGIFELLWLFIILSSLQPLAPRQLLAASRRRVLAKIAKERDATVITLIHRQETMSFLGIPLMRYIDIDDSQGVLRAIRGTTPGRTIEIILHTPGGLVLAASQIAKALRDHEGRVVAVVPHYAMSGGTLIALAADEIVLDTHAALGSIDPQLGQYPAASLVEVSKMPAGTATRRCFWPTSGARRCGRSKLSPSSFSSATPRRIELGTLLASSRRVSGRTTTH